MALKGANIVGEFVLGIQMSFRPSLVDAIQSAIENAEKSQIRE